MSLKLRRVSALVAFIIILLPFQNCSNEPDATTDEASSYQSKLPMGYKAQVDTLAYMSCSGITDAVEKRAYFSFRAGAYNPATGGLTMTDEFRDATRFYSNTERARAFSESDHNFSTRLTLSVRQVGNYQAPWQEGEFLVGEEQESFLPPLDSAEVAGPLASLAAGNMINYFPGTQSKRLMEASVRLFKYENTVKQLRSELGSGSAALVVGYSDTSDEGETALRGPTGTDNAKIYGRGYRMQFSLPVGFTSGEARVISPNGGVTEMNLEDGSTISSNWECSTGYQFMVVRPEDVALNPSLCPAIVDKTNNASELAALTAIRRVLRVEDWFVNVQYRCIVPKRTGDYCYGPLNGRTIQYGSSSCVNSSTSGGTMCPHFVSVCVRH